MTTYNKFPLLNIITLDGLQRICYQTTKQSKTGSVYTLLSGNVVTIADNTVIRIDKTGNNIHIN